MIDNSVLQVSKVHEQALHEELRIDPPLENKVVGLTPISFIRSGGQWTVDWTNVEPDRAVSLMAAKMIAQNIVASAQAEVDRNPTSSRAHANLGLAFLKERHFKEAAEQFEIALNFNPDFYLALLNLAKTKMRLGQLDEAASLYEKARQQKDDDPTAQIGLAHIAMRHGDYKQAVDLLNRTIKQHDTALPRFQMGIALLCLGMKDRALSQFRSAARLQVRSPSLHVSLGAAYVMLRDFSRATRSFRTALSLSPRMLTAVHGLAITLIDRHDTESASRLLSEHLKIQPEDFRAREILAQAFISECHFNEAYNQLSKAYETVKLEYPEARDIKCRITNNLGLCDSYLGHTNRAEEWYKKSIEFAGCLGKDDIIPFHNLAKLYLNSDRTLQAYKLLAFCKDRFPDNPETELLTATAMINESRFNEACQVLDNLIDHSDAPPEAYAILGYLNSDEKPLPEFERALSVLKQGHAKYPEYMPTINNLAYVLLMLNKAGDAERLLMSIPPEKIAEDVFLTATSGLLHLVNGEVESGTNLYLRAEQLAREKGSSDLATIVRQKMHLELAKLYWRFSRSIDALNEVKAGLNVRKGRDSYRRQLEALNHSIEV